MSKLTTAEGIFNVETYFKTKSIVEVLRLFNLYYTSLLISLGYLIDEVTAAQHINDLGNRIQNDTNLLRQGPALLRRVVLDR